MERAAYLLAGEESTGYVTTKEVASCAKLLKLLSVGNPPSTVWGSMGDSKALLHWVDQCPKQKSADRRPKA